MFVLLYALFAYAGFLAVMTALVLWLHALQTPPASASLLPALIVDLLLILLFAVQHTVMAREPFKRSLLRLLPPAAERPTYVLASNGVLAALIAGWQRLPGMVWAIEGPLAWALFAAAGLGWIVGVAATFQFDHLSLFGLRQAIAAWRGRSSEMPDRFAVPLLYRWVRHPMMTGFLLAFWLTPLMSVDRLVLATGLSVYIAIGIRFEERSLRRRFGAQYTDYAARTPALLPWPWPRAASPPAT